RVRLRGAARCLVNSQQFGIVGIDRTDFRVLRTALGGGCNGFARVRVVTVADAFAGVAAVAGLATGTPRPGGRGFVIRPREGIAIPGSAGAVERRGKLRTDPPQEPKQ